MNTMNLIMLMPQVGGGCGNFADLPSVLLTFVIAGVILIILGIFANILHIKFSQGFNYTPICWVDIKPTIDNSFLGCLGGVLGVIFICRSIIMGLIVGVYWCIITL